MTEIYYERLEETDLMLEELVNLKDELHARIVKERDDQIEQINIEFLQKENYIQERFNISATRTLARLGETIPKIVMKDKKK
jgi:hypothetical protein